VTFRIPRRLEPVESLTTTQENNEVEAPPVRAAAEAGSTLMRLRIAMAVLWTVVILVLCWMPGKWVQELEQESPWFQVPDLDKVVHWGIFVVFTVLWLRTSTSTWRYAWVALGGLALASISELVQMFPAIGRDAEVGDAITDLIGVALGLALARWIEPLLRRAESRVFRTRTA
jgi:VanZ family protein